MRVCLINPPQMQLRQPRAYIPLGLAYIGAVLGEAGIEVKVVNLADTVVDTTVVEKLPEADFYGLTCVTATYRETVKLSRMLKQLRNGKVIVGGAHPSILPEETLHETGCDHVITGEAEYAFKNLVKGRPSGKIIHAGIIKNLNELPFPARHLFEYSDVVDETGIHGSEKKSTTIISSRGCPYSCRYCCRRHDMFKVFRYRSSENVYQELKLLKETYGIGHVRFIDDCFTANRKRVFELCHKIKDSEITFICITRADRVDYEMLKTLKESGCIQVDFGIESGSQKILDAMNKQITVEKALKSIQFAKNLGLTAKLFLMHGFPGETEQDIELSVKFVEKAKPTLITLSRFTPIPGSEIYHNPRKYGVTNLEDQWFYPDEDLEHVKLKNRLLKVMQNGS